MTEAVFPIPFSAEERHLAAADLRLLAMLAEREPTRDLVEALAALPRAEILRLQPADAAGERALDLFALALAQIPTPVDRATLDELAADHAAIYLTNGHGAAPMESVWVDPDGLWGQDAMFEVRDWYRHWGLEVPDWRVRTDDHLVVQLLFVARLLDAVEAPAALPDLARFLDLHLLRWLGAFAEAVMRRAWTAYHAGLVALLHARVEALRDGLARREGFARVELEPIESEKRRRREAADRETCASARESSAGTGPTI